MTRRSLQGAVLVLALAAAAGLLEAQGELVGLFVDQNGEVGVGTTNPLAQLHVAGDLLATGVVRGQGYQGRYNNAAAMQGFTVTGAPAVFTFSYNDSLPTNREKIQIVNAATGVFKTFIIPHPVDTERFLVHATLEGPEGAVFYRGSARLTDGTTEIALPPYFEALTAAERRTILLTNVGGFDRLAVRPYADGRVGVCPGLPRPDRRPRGEGLLRDRRCRRARLRRPRRRPRHRLQPLSALAVAARAAGLPGRRAGQPGGQGVDRIRPLPALGRPRRGGRRRHLDRLLELPRRLALRQRRRPLWYGPAQPPRPGPG